MMSFCKAPLSGELFYDLQAREIFLPGKGLLLLSGGYSEGFKFMGPTLCVQ
jgi:hypothetical protein